MFPWMKRAGIPALVLLSIAIIAPAATIDLGYISYDVTQPGSTAEFDIVNQTGPNSSIFPDPSFPISTAVNLSSLSLTVDFTGGGSTVFGSSYFTLAADGLSFNGNVIPIGGTNPLPIDAMLTGTFSPTTVTLNDGSTVTLDGSFTTSIPSNLAGLSDGDLALISASTGGTPAIPEPGTMLMLAVPLGAIALLRRGWLNKAASRRGLTLLAVCAFVAIAPTFAATTSVNLNVVTSPDNGVAGVNFVNITGTGFPSGTITSANTVAMFAPACGGAAAATAPAASIKTVVGTNRRVSVKIPGSLATGTYFISLSDAAPGDAPFKSSNCSSVKVTHTNATLSACLPTSSLGILVPSKPGTVTSYVPNGCWSCSATGVQAVNVEGPASATTIATPNVTNSCSSNPATGQTVCVGNNTDVYLITGTTLTSTLASGASAFASFSGGSCQNCGVATNALNNKAVINMGLSGSPSGDGIQMLNLNTNVFETPIPTQNSVSEDISIDPTRNLILSPSESAVYSLLQIQADGSTVKEFGNSQQGKIGNFDSAAEDCSTGIALASEEAFPYAVFVADLTQATLTPGVPAGTWTAPSTNFQLITSYSFSASTDGIAVASGSSHLAVITGEFGGNTFAVLQLPATSGSGTPTILDYAVAQVPDSSTCGGPFSAGLDPHTVTAYTSPNDGKAYALFANSPAPSCLVRIDLAALLAAPRGGAGLMPNDVAAANFPASAASYHATH
jgi:hypothetical protein